MNSRRVFGKKRETIRYKIHHFYTKNEKNWEKTGKTGEKTLKTGKNRRKKTGKKALKNRKKQEKNRKLQEIQKRVFDEVLGNANCSTSHAIFKTV